MAKRSDHSHITASTMASLWNGNLRNTATDIAIDMYVAILVRVDDVNSGADVTQSRLLCVFILAAYGVQLQQSITQGSMNGIPSYYLLFNILFSNVQLSESLLLAAYAWPNDLRPVLQLIGDGSLRGWAALGGIFGVLQLALQWACSIVS